MMNPLTKTLCNPIKLILIISVLMLEGHNGSAQKSLLTAEKLWELGRISDPQVSPDGQWIIYGVTWYKVAENRGKNSLYITSVRTGETRVVRELVNDVYNARWRPDGKKIGFLSEKSGSMQLWEMDIKGDQIVQVTSFDLPIDNFSYSPDMKHIAFTMKVKLEQSVNDNYTDLPKADARIMDDLMYRHWDSWKDYKYSHLCIIDYNDGKSVGAVKDIMLNEKFDCPLKPFGTAGDITWSPDGFSLFYVCKKYTGKEFALNTNSDIYWYDVPSGTTSNITQAFTGYDLLPVVSPDGTKLAWLSMDEPGYESDQREIKIFEIKTGKIKTLTENFDQDISSICWGGDNKSVYFISSISGTEQVFKASLGTSVFNKINISGNDITQLTSGIFDITEICLSGQDLIAGVMSMSSPLELHTINTKSGKMSQLTKINDPVWSGINTGQVVKKMIRTTDNKEMLVWVILPPGFKPDQKYPCLLYCQGGPQSQVSQFFSFRWNFQLMAANGYVVVAPNRRGLPGFGGEWNREISGDWGGQAMKDYLTAIDTMMSESYVDRNNVGAVGASYGGYSVYYLAGIHQNRFKAFIAHCGIYDLESWYGSTEELFSANKELEGAYWIDPKPKSYDLFSPDKLVKNWNTPMLIIHGAKDFRVPENQAMEAFTALQLKNIPSRFLYFPNENHWILSPQNGILWNRVFFDWLDKWLKN
jgi:dipeptidyl aminopeptidase/acylaminoacyl peptidase